MSFLKRRGFLGKSVLVGTGAIAAVSSSIKKASGKRRTFKRKNPASVELLHIGCLASDYTSHLGLWGPLINPGEGSIRRSGMVFSHCWDYDKKLEERFSKQFGAKRVKDYTEMIGRVDGIIIPSYATALRVNKYLIKPYLESEVPVFINRPFAFRMSDAEDMVNMSKKTGTPLMTGSAFEYCKETPLIKRAVEQCAPLFGAAMTGDTGDFASHGIHPIYWMNRIFGGNVTRISYYTKDCKERNGAVHAEYAPQKDNERPFYVNMLYMGNVSTKSWGSANIMGENGSQFIHIYTEGNREDMLDHFFLPLLLAAQKMFETGDMPEPHEAILSKTRMFLAAFKSHLEHGGAPLNPADLPRDWTVPQRVHRYDTKPDSYPEGFFAE